MAPPLSRQACTRASAVSMISLDRRAALSGAATALLWGVQRSDARASSTLAVDSAKLSREEAKLSAGNSRSPGAIARGALMHTSFTLVPPYATRARLPCLRRVMQPRDLHKPQQQVSPLGSCLRGICLLLILGLAYVALRVQPTEGPSAVYEKTPALHPVGGAAQVAAAPRVAADLSAAAAVSARQLVPRPSQATRTSPPPTPARVPLSACAHVLNPSMCPAWVRARDHPERRARGVGLPPQRPRRCEADCHGRGVCNAATGVCACLAGYNGSSCGTLNPRPCNGGKNDGLWHGSHCAGECDELTGFCWCPGRLRVRPMGERCPSP